MAARDFFLSVVETSAGIINQIESVNLDSGVEQLINSYDGQHLPTAAYVLTQKPRMTFSSTAIARALGFVNLLTGYPLTSADFNFQPAVNGGTRDTADCTVLSATSGLLCVESIEASEGRLASISLMAYPTSADGIVAPLGTATAGSLPAAVTTRQGYTVGPAVINGTLLEGIRSLRLNMNIQVQQVTYDGYAYPQLAYILEIKPVFTLRTANVETIDALGFFAAQGLTDSVLHLSRLTENGIRAANATASHISFTLDDGLIVNRGATGQHNQPAEAEFEFHPVYDGTAALVVVNTATAIVLP